ncbi:MAG: PepSY-associated TM helix domain-containing protein [Pseudomonadota bacterium]
MIFSRKTWLTCHRLIGLYSLVFLLTLAVSGLVLSFSDALKLETRQVFSHAQTLQLSEHRVTLSGERVELDGIDAGVRCHGPIAGVVDLTEQGQVGVQIVCQNAVYWLSREGDVIDSINVSSVNRPITRSTYSSKGLLLETSKGMLNWQLEPSTLVSVIPPSQSLPPLPSIDHQGTNMAQWVLNLHTGLIAGDLGRWLMRLAGLGLILLCVSGLKNALRR